MSESKASVARAKASGKAESGKKVAPRRFQCRAVLAVFARAPQRGKVKTRLAKTLGDDAALQLYIAMLRDTLTLSRRAMGRTRGATVLFFTPRAACDSHCAAREYSRENLSWRAAFHTRRAVLHSAVSAEKSACEYSQTIFNFKNAVALSAVTRDEARDENSSSDDEMRNENVSCEYSLRALWGGAALPQSDGDLGKKMRACCDELRARGARRVVLIGSDIPDLPPEIITAAFDALKNYDLVFGPAGDGGFYLLGASRRFSRALFSGVRWSRADVLARVLANARREKLRVFLLPEWRDVDDLNDVRALKTRLRARR